MFWWVLYCKTPSRQIIKSIKGLSWKILSFYISLYSNSCTGKWLKNWRKVESVQTYLLRWQAIDHISTLAAGSWRVLWITLARDCLFWPFCSVYTTSGITKEVNSRNYHSYSSITLGEKIIIKLSPAHLLVFRMIPFKNR
jgi:hypothetical protein